MDAPRIRVLLVDDHPLVREGMRARLASVPRIEVVGEADSGDAALEWLAAEPADLMLLDIGMKGMSGVDLARVAAVRHPELAIVVLSMHDEPHYVREVVQAGARGYVLKDAPSSQVVLAIEVVAGGGSYFSSSIASVLVDPKEPERSLSHRERQVLGFLAQGLSSKAIARTLDISARTIEAHRTSIKRKLNIEGRGELIKFAVERARR